MNSLATYRAKRDFSRTREPAGSPPRRPRRAAPQFVIQKHAASHLHFDFRLELDGVLKSWAVPKGIPTRQGDRRLAVEVEDHPLEYGRFEGNIPAGSYGGGTVQLWDRGRYEIPDPAPAKAWRRGKLSFVLHGKKLRGHWTLVRTRSGDAAKPAWLLIKTEESLPALSVNVEARSALSGKTLAEISRGRKIWKSSRPAAWEQGAASRGSAPGSFKARIQALAARRRPAP